MLRFECPDEMDALNCFGGTYKDNSERTSGKFISLCRYKFVDKNPVKFKPH